MKTSALPSSAPKHETSHSRCHPSLMALHDANAISERGKVQANVALAFLVLAWFFIALRVWTRTYVIANFGWDDSTMVLAGAIFTVYCAAMIYLTANGGASHITDMGEMSRLIKWTIIGEATYLVTVMVLKISLGIFFARIVIKPWQLWTIYITVGVNILSNISSFFYVLLRCGPNLDMYVYNQFDNKCTGHTLNNIFAYQQAALTTLTDLVFAILPIPILWNTYMDTRSKISVGFILSLGALGIICSILRFRYVDGLTQIEDFFWNATNIAIWSTIEPGAGIVAGCLATLRPFFKGAFVKARSIRSSMSHSTKDLSRSFRSPNNSSDPKSATESRNQPPTTTPQAPARPPNIYPQYDEDLELKSDVHQIRKGESAECILHNHVGVDLSWISNPGMSRDSLELDRQTSIAKDSIQSSATTNRTRVGSYDRSVLSTSPDTLRRDIWMV